MKPYLADTSLFVAFLNPRDEYHEPAVEYIRQESNPLMTTSWILVELGNFVCKSRTRRRFVPFVSSATPVAAATSMPCGRSRDRKSPCVDVQSKTRIERGENGADIGRPGVRRLGTSA